MISWKPAIVSSSLTYSPGRARERSATKYRLRQEPLDLARALDGQLVLVGELVHAEDRDDVLQVLVALEDLLHRASPSRSARRETMPGLERARERVERVDGRVDALLDDRAREHGRRVEVRERVRRRRVGEVVGRHVDRLHRRDRAGARRGDPLLELAHLGRERRLVADRARHAAEQRRDLGAGLDEAEDVVDEEEHVLALVAEVLGHRQAGEADAQARSRRLVHLAVDERRPCRVTPDSVISSQRSLPSRVRSPTPGEDGDAAVLRARRCGSAPGSAPSCRAPAPPKSPTLPPLTYGAIRSMTLMPVSKISIFGDRSREGRRLAMDRPALACLPAAGSLSSTGSPITFQSAAERRLADRNGDRLPGVDDVGAAREAVGRVHGHGADAVVAEVLLHLGDQVVRRRRPARGR